MFELTLWCKQPTLFSLLNIEREYVWALNSHCICYLNLATTSDACSGQGNAEDTPGVLTGHLVHRGPDD